MNTDYLRFSANSLKDLIVNKLTADGTYSDQLYEGSDLSVLIDVFSYMFDTMAYLENQGAAEAIFTDAQYYENMNRIVKMLGYNPVGFITSTVPVKLGIREDMVYNEPGIVTIPKYTTYTTALSDKWGNAVRYTFVEDFTIITQDTTVASEFMPTLYNGTWEVYPMNLKTIGIPFETYTLQNIDVQVTPISHKHIDIYVNEGSDDVYKWEGVNNIYDAKPTDRVFEYRLNENKQYTLTFGDDINGKKIPKDAILTIIYLVTNSVDGEIGPHIIQPDGELRVEISGLDEAFIKKYILDVDNNPEYILFGNNPDEQLSIISADNLAPSSITKDVENVEDIRTKAPKWFRMGSRLITSQDFEQFVLSSYPSDAYDITVQNNWEYMAEFQTWLHNYGLLTNEIKHFGYKFSDSCDFNNIYLWIKSFSDLDITSAKQSTIERDINRIKPLTAEIVPLNPFLTMFAPYVTGRYGLGVWDDKYENKLTVTRDKNSMVTVERIKQNVISTVIDFFALKHQKLGAVIDINRLYTLLMAIDGVEKIQTTHLEDGAPENQREYYDGLSFGVWTPYMVKGKDFQKISGNYKLKSFQFPTLFDTKQLTNIVDVVGDIYNISNAEY